MEQPNHSLHILAVNVNFLFSGSLSVIKQECPSKSVTAQCIVKKNPSAQNFYLLWTFTYPGGGSKECTAFCQEGPIICPIRELYNVSVTECSCDGTVIVSEATFNPTSQCDVMLSCSQGQGTKNNISASIKGHTTNNWF